MKGAAERKDEITVYVMRGERRNVGKIYRCIRMGKSGDLVVTYAGTVYTVKGNDEDGYFIEIN